MKSISPGRVLMEVWYYNLYSTGKTIRIHNILLYQDKACYSAKTDKYESKQNTTECQAINTPLQSQPVIPFKQPQKPA